MFGGVIGGGFGGFAGGTASGLLSGESFDDALALGAKGTLFGAAVGGLVGTAQGIKYAKANNLDAWSGAAKSSGQGFKSLGAAGKGFNKVLQSGGQKLNSSTLKALNLTKDQGRNAIHALKADWGLPNNFHGKIMGNGDYLHPSTGKWLGNLFDYVY